MQDETLESGEDVGGDGTGEPVEPDEGDVLLRLPPLTSSGAAANEATTTAAQPADESVEADLITDARDDPTDAQPTPPAIDAPTAPVGEPPLNRTPLVAAEGVEGEAEPAASEPMAPVTLTPAEALSTVDALLIPTAVPRAAATTDATRTPANLDALAANEVGHAPAFVDAEGLSLKAPELSLEAAASMNAARLAVGEAAAATGTQGSTFVLTPNTATVAPGTAVLQAAALPPMPIAQAAPQLAQHIESMMEDEVWSMKLRLDPPKLGTVDVQLAVRDQQVAVSLGSGDAQARMLLAQALPELANALAARGLQLMGADVGHPSQGRDEAPARHLARSIGGGDASQTEFAPTRERARQGVVDHYA